MSDHINLSPATTLAISRQALSEFDRLSVDAMSRADMAFWLGQLKTAVRMILAHSEPIKDDAPGETGRYGDEFDRLADRWRALEDEHDQTHPDRSDCGGVGGCPMMRAAHDLTVQMEDQLEEWRHNLAIREGRRPCSCDHHGDHAGCDADCECAR